MLLLHLSDIHFRREEIGTPLDPNNHLRNALTRDAEMMCKRLGKAPTAILISGDIAYAAHSEEYAYALTWLEKLSSACGTTSESIFVIPGNHDVSRSMAAKPMVQALHAQIKSANPMFLDGMLRGFLLDGDTSRVLYAPLDEFNLFAGQFFCDVSAPMRTIAYRDLKLNDGSILRLTGFNSALASSHADKIGDLYVDPACFQITKERGVEHLILCHHPFSWLRQGEILKGHLNDVAPIQLFGHEHMNRIELQRDTIRIAASAAHPDRTEYGWEPGYNLIELEVSSTDSERVLNVAAHVRIWQSTPGQFRAKMDGQSDVFTHRMALETWTPNPVMGPTSTNVTGNFNEFEITEPTHGEIELGSDPMDDLRNISIRFFKLTLSQKSAVAGKLGLLEDEDMNQPDFERFRRVFMRAKERDLVQELDREVGAAMDVISKKT